MDFTVVKLTGIDGALGPVTTLPPCRQDTECTDSDPCTVESCTPVGCASQPGPTFVDCRLSAAEDALDTILPIMRNAPRKKLGGKALALK